MIYVTQSLSLSSREKLELLAAENNGLWAMFSNIISWLLTLFDNVNPSVFLHPCSVIVVENWSNGRRCSRKSLKQDGRRLRHFRSIVQLNVILISSDRLRFAAQQQRHSSTIWINKTQLINTNKAINFPTKTILYRSLVLPVLLYGCESWTLTADLGRRIQACLRGFCCQASQVIMVRPCISPWYAAEDHTTGIRGRKASQR